MRYAICILCDRLTISFTSAKKWANWNRYCLRKGILRQVNCGEGGPIYQMSSMLDSGAFLASLYSSDLKERGIIKKHHSAQTFGAFNLSNGKYMKQKIFEIYVEVNGNEGNPIVDPNDPIVPDQLAIGGTFPVMSFRNALRIHSIRKATSEITACQASCLFCLHTLASVPAVTSCSWARTGTTSSVTTRCHCSRCGIPMAPRHHRSCGQPGIRLYRKRTRLL